MENFEEAALRLKQELRVKADKDVAGALGLSPVAWVGRKKRGKFPEVELRALAQQRPELAIDVLASGRSSIWTCHLWRRHSDRPRSLSRRSTRSPARANQ